MRSHDKLQPTTRGNSLSPVAVRVQHSRQPASSEFLTRGPACSPRGAWRTVAAPRGAREDRGTNDTKAPLLPLRGGNNAPKGFGHFYPKGKTTTKGGASGKKTSGGAKASSTKKSSSGGGGDGGGGMPPDGVPRIVSALAAIGLGVVWLSSRENQGTEINWQEFATVLLESGEVDRIIVTNSKVAEVCCGPTPPCPYRSGRRRPTNCGIRTPGTRSSSSLQRHSRRGILGSARADPAGAVVPFCDWFRRNL